MKSWNAWSLASSGRLRRRSREKASSSAARRDPMSAPRPPNPNRLASQSPIEHLVFFLKLLERERGEELLDVLAFLRDGSHTLVLQELDGRRDERRRAPLGVHQVR